MKISLITVSYNSDKTIRETFESVKNQNLTGFELEYILIDGLSTDSTMQIAKEYENIISFKVSEKDLGIYNAMNKGVELASGDVIGFLNSDDTFIENNILMLISNSFKKKNIDIIYGDINYTNHSGKILRRWKSGNKKSFANGWHPAHPAFYVKKTLFTKEGNFDESISITADFDLMLRFMEVSDSSYEYLEKVFVNMKLGGESNQSFKNIKQGNKEILDSFKKYKIKPRYLYSYRRWFNKLKQYL